MQFSSQSLSGGDSLKVQSSLNSPLGNGSRTDLHYTIHNNSGRDLVLSLLSDDVTMTSLWHPDLVLPITLISSVDPKSSEHGYSFMECNYVHSMVPVSVPLSAGHLTILKGRPWGTS